MSRHKKCRILYRCGISLSCLLPDCLQSSGFAMLSWTALGFFGLFLQVVPRMLELIRQLGKATAVDKSAA